MPPTIPIRFARVSDSALVTLADTLALQLMNWNDWFEWRTLFYAYYFDTDAVRHDVGAIKIARLGHEYINNPANATPLPDEFFALDDTYVAVAQDESFYTTLRQHLGSTRAREALLALGDLAASPERLDQVRYNDVVARSLLRSVSAVTVKTTFHRLVQGLGHSAYEFTYTRTPANPLIAPVEMDFAVVPDSTPPTNVHVLIGRNGSGKTTHLRDMALALLGDQAAPTTARFAEGAANSLDIANVVYVSFSAFDEAVLPVLDDDERYDVRYSYVGLLTNADRDVGQSENRTQVENLAAPRRTLAPEDLATSFAESAWVVIREKSRALWREALTNLESDPIFAEADVSALADEEATVSQMEFQGRAAALFARFSSGHKIVLLAITRLVQTVTERSLVLIDEPEGHLHPPLLAAYVRTLSSLMTTRNGVAIVATHSPVILQEVPRSCVWRIGRSGEVSVAERLGIETFGENVGVLTSSVFGLEVSDSGFHKLLIEAAIELRDFEAVESHFGEQLGSDARAVVTAWFADEGLLSPRHRDRRAWGERRG